jgi:hypothetical protein
MFPTFSTKSPTRSSPQSLHVPSKHHSSTQRNKSLLKTCSQCFTRMFKCFRFPRRLRCSHSVFSLESRSIDVPLFFVFVKLFVVSLQFETLTLKVFAVYTECLSDEVESIESRDFKAKRIRLKFMRLVW